jgi:hypothetical protein
MAKIYALLTRATAMVGLAALVLGLAAVPQTAWAANPSCTGTCDMSPNAASTTCVIVWQNCSTGCQWCVSQPVYLQGTNSVVMCINDHCL